MIQAISALLGALICATIGILGGLALEGYRRYRDKNATASALAGEIASLLYMAEVRKYVELFDGFLQRLNTGENVSIPRITDGRDYRDPVFDCLFDKLGLPPGDLPERSCGSMQC